MDCNSFQFSNQDYIKIEILKWFGENLYLHILSNYSFFLVCLKFGFYNNIGYFYIKTNTQNFMQCLV